MAALPGFDPTVPNDARILDYILGGKDNFSVDREAAERVIALAPDFRMMVAQGRRFQRRVVRFLVGAGVRQFIDVACGLLTQGAVHEVAHEVNPRTRVAYVDNDPVVATHARALLKGNPLTAFVASDMRDTDEMLAELDATPVIDLREPVAVLLHAALPLVPEDDLAASIVERIRTTIAPGSYLGISHAISDSHPVQTERLADLYQDEKIVQGSVRRRNLRTRAEVSLYFAHLDLVEPGIVNFPLWRPEPDDPPIDPAAVWAVGGVGRRL
ncbi:SAM-dependent methyltransferase [Spirillospora sp. NPDC047279]|uniref:SAM-dependent methyltransferase n=1 Tax=Spirillospora sp. NPDC047279 TaxID=3155478 RepID=UPI0033EF801E